jgi:diguanylate cyclase (GGDEF)-like protein
LRVTISLGLASVPAGDKSVEDLISSADAALYAAKGAGRNRLMREEDRLAA